MVGALFDTTSHDWIETARAAALPMIHNVLAPLGLFGIATVDERQYVATFDLDEETLETLFIEDLNFERNPLAAYKSHAEDSRESTMSLRLTHAASESRFDRLYVEPRRQLHLTFLPAQRGSGGEIDIYAHNEYSWLTDPLKHLRSKEVRHNDAVKKTLALLRHETFCVEDEDYTVYER